MDPTTLEDGKGDGTGPSSASKGRETDARRGQAEDGANVDVKVVFKKGVSVDGANENDRDEALSEVGQG